MTFSGTCHCGAVAFTVDADTPTEAVSCNCSHCRRKGLLLGFFAPDQFTLDRGEAVLGRYLFNTHKIEHQFCTMCGVEPFAHGTGPHGRPMQAINLRCVDGIDLDALALHAFDGAARL